MQLFRFRKKTSEVPRRRRSLDADASFEPRTQYAYRRNQTISGIRPEAPADSPRGKVHSLAEQRRKVAGLFAMVFAAVVVLTLLLTQLVAQLTVTTSTRQLTTAFESAPYEAAIQEYLGINPAERLRFTLSEERLSSFVATQLPEVEALKVSGVRNMVTTQFSVTFRQPVAGWVIDGKQHYVDAQGIVFDKNYYEAPTVQIIDQSGIDPERGTAVAGSRLLAFLGRVVARAGESGLTVTEAVLPANTTRQLQVRLKDIPTVVTFSIDRGAGEQVEDMTRSLKYLQSQGIAATTLDIRVSGRAAYK